MFLLFATIVSAVAAYNPFFQLVGSDNNKRSVTTTAGGGIPFRHDWLSPPQRPQNLELLELDRLPKVLPYPSFLRVYEFQDDNRENGDCPQIDNSHDESFERLAHAARQVIDQDLGTYGAVLLRNLHRHIRSAHDFSVFWHAMCKNNPHWIPAERFPFGRPRDTMEGIDLATNIPPPAALPCHNEEAYNPHIPSRIALYCLQDAVVGGESLLQRNEDINDHIRDEVPNHIKQHGIEYIRSYQDRDASSTNLASSPFPFPSWQEKCETEDRGQAVEYFIHRGFSRDDVSFQSNGTLKVVNRHSGFWRDTASGKDLWFNILPFPGVKESDSGQDFPEDLMRKLQVDLWRAVCAMKLRPGDWLVLDNRRVQHGRLPYQDDDPDKPRTLFTVYTK